MGVDTGHYSKEAELRAVVCVLLSEATKLGIDRRILDHKPYLKKILIQRSEDPGPGLTGFTREISNKGVGLLHAFPLKPNDDIVIVVAGPDQTLYRLQVAVSWCKQFGDGWYVSGCQFVAKLDS